MNSNSFLIKNSRVAEHFSNLCDVLPPQSNGYNMGGDYHQQQMHSTNPYVYQQQQSQHQHQQDYHHMMYSSPQPMGYYNSNMVNHNQQPMLGAAISLSSIHKARSSIPNNIHQKSMTTPPKVFVDSADMHSDTNTPAFSSDNSSPTLDQPSSPIDMSHSNGSLELFNFTGSSEMRSNKLTTSSSSSSLHSLPSFSLNQSIDAQADYDSLREAWKKTRDLSQELTKISKQASKSEFTLVDSVLSLQKEYENLGNLLNFMNDKANNLKNDERLKKKKKESDRNAEKRKKRREATMLLNNVCKNCNTTDTPEWRKGPDGTKSLCNACGLHYAKNLKRETMNQPNPVTQPKETMKVLSILN